MDAHIERNTATIPDLIAHAQQTDRRLDTLTENVGILAQNMITLVHKVDDLSDDVRDLKQRPPQ